MAGIATDRPAIARHESEPLGPLGLRELLEPEIRRLVAALTDAPEEWLHGDVSFADDLALDRAALTELVVAVESHAGASVPDSAIDRIRTYDDLVEAVVDARTSPRRRSSPPIFLRATIVPPRERRGIVTRSGWLTPYVTETIVADAVRAGRGSRLEITVPASVPLAAAERVDACFAHLGPRGVTVVVQHERSLRGRAVA
jgi:acyl carrier protein